MERIHQIYYCLYGDSPNVIFPQQYLCPSTIKNGWDEDGKLAKNEDLNSNKSTSSIT
jgi:hypothetical protein